MSMFIILLLGVVLRLYRLGIFSFWFDEAVSAYWSDQSSLLNMWKLQHPSCLYFWFLHYWRLLGTAESILRLSSVFFGIASIIGIYYLGQLLFVKKTGILSAFLLAISPFHIYYSQELRMYTLISFLSIMSTLLFFKALEENKNIFWFGYIIFSVLILNIQAMTSLILFAQAAFFFINIKRYKPLLKKWVISHAVIISFFILWLIIFLRKVSFVIGMYGNSNHIIDKPLPVSLKNVFFTFKNFSIGYNAAKFTFITMSALFLSLFLWGAVKIKKKRELTLLLCCLVIPICATFVVSKLGIWFYVDRYFISNSVFFYLIVASGVSSLKKKYSIPVLFSIAIFSAFALMNYYRNYFPDPSLTSVEHRWVEAKKEWREAAGYLSENFQEGDVIFHTCVNTTLPLRWYFALGHPGLERGDEIVLRFDSNSQKPVPYAYSEREGVFIDYSGKISIDDQDRVWLVLSWWNFDPQPLFPPVIKIVEWMEKYYIKSELKEFNGAIVYLFTRPGKDGKD